MPTGSSEIVTAPAFHVLDEQGRPRAMLPVSPVGPSLTLLDAQGEPRARLGVTGGRESLNLWNAAGRGTFTAP